MTIRQKIYMWTKNEIRTLMSLWDTKSPDDIAESLRITKTQVMYMVGMIRKVNPTALTRKRKNAYLNTMINEVLAEN